ncbi:MAG: hypothetical protein ACRD0U_09695, partial [Acidimicrobiales bacterium]
MRETNPRRTSTLLPVLLGTTLMTAACAGPGSEPPGDADPSPTDTTPDAVFPDPEWTTVDPEELGF